MATNVTLVWSLGDLPCSRGRSRHLVHFFLAVSSKNIAAALATLHARLQDVFFYHNFCPHRSKAVGRTRACVGRSDPNICQLLSMFGGIVDISKGSGSPHTWSVQWPRLGVLQNGYSSLVFQFRAARSVASTTAMFLLDTAKKK